MHFENIEIPSRLFVTGIGTDVGKSYATGWLAREIAKAGKTVVTQKFVQTGNKDYSEDISVHRQIMGIDNLPEDIDHTTAPIILSYPASPDLAAKIDNVTIDFGKATRSTEKLSANYDVVLVEGAGGLLVPLRGEWLTADYVAEQNLSTVLVINGQLGSINHTLLSLQAIKNYGIKLFAVVYNTFFDKDKIICADTREYVKNYLVNHFDNAYFIEMNS
jgi:dethiobiotin synthetase